MPCEVWKLVPGYDGIYEVSNLGGFRSGETGKALSTKKNNRGYVQVRLTRRGKCDHWLLHRLVATVFIPNPDGLPQVNHKDEDKDNNRADNLEWCTNLYNRRYGTGYQRSVDKHDYLALAEQNKRTVRQYDLSGNLIKVWVGLKEIQKSTGIGESNIRRCCYGRGKSAGGYVWEYV